MSGLVESRRYSDVFYSIEDSGNGNSVYAISKNGTVVGNNDMILPSSVIFFVFFKIPRPSSKLSFFVQI